MNNNNNAPGWHHPNLDDRQAAERKLCRLFASFGIDAMTARERLIDPFIMKAAQFWRGHSGLDFAALAQDEAEMALTAWFTDIFAVDDQSEPASVVMGRAAFLMCDGPDRFADLFLVSIEDLPAEFVAMMRRHAPMLLPPSDQGEMNHQPYEAWSVRHVLAKASPVDKSFMQALGAMVRRDGRSLGFIWRNTGSTS